MKHLTFAVCATLISAQSFALCSKELNQEHKRPFWESSISSTIGQGKAWTVANMRRSLVFQKKRTKLAIANTLEAKSSKISDLIAAINDTDDGEVSVNYLYQPGDKKPDYIQVTSASGDTEFGKIFKMDGTSEVLNMSDGDIESCSDLAHKSTEIRLTTEDEDGVSTQIYNQSNVYELIQLSHDLNYGDILLKSACYEGTISGVKNLFFKMMDDEEMIGAYGKFKKNYDENNVELETSVSLTVENGTVEFDLGYQFADELEIDLSYTVKPCK